MLALINEVFFYCSTATKMGQKLSLEKRLPKTFKQQLFFLLGQDKSQISNLKEIHFLRKTHQQTFHLERFLRAYTLDLLFLFQRSYGKSKVKKSNGHLSVDQKKYYSLTFQIQKPYSCYDVRKFIVSTQAASDPKFSNHHTQGAFLIKIVRQETKIYNKNTFLRVIY